MERVKVALRFVALALSAQVVPAAVPEARAQSPGPITSTAWSQEFIGALKGPEKALGVANAHAAEVNAWMTENPGQPVSRTTRAACPRCYLSASVYAPSSSPAMAHPDGSGSPPRAPR